MAYLSTAALAELVYSLNFSFTLSSIVVEGLMAYP